MQPTLYFDAFTLDPIGPPPASAWSLADVQATRCVVGTAFFDPQVNGFAGVDFTNPDITRHDLESAALGVRTAGCSQFLLTLVTAEVDFLEHQFRHVAHLCGESDLLRKSIPGFHLEGPFISPKSGYRGAHPERYVQPPDWSLFERLQKASGNRIRMITLAPEWPNSADFIRRATASGVFVCLGHTDASRDELLAASAAGARMVTHLGNGCPLEMHRHDNIIQRVLAVEDLLVSLIPDGIHLPPFVLSNLSRALSPNRLVFTTDAVAPAGAPGGRYRIGHQEVVVGKDRVVMHADGKHFVGSALTMREGYHNAVRFGGLGIPAAWRAWTWLRKVILPDIEPPLLILPVEDASVSLHRRK